MAAIPGVSIRPRGPVPGWTAGLWPLLAAALARALPLLGNRFHPDEALYAGLALRIASGRDPLLAGALVDKPPLSFYVNALSLALLGRTEFAARLPSLLAGVVSVALLFALARRLYGPAAASLAAWALALSPFAILFSITAFIDPLLTACLLWGLWAAAAGRWSQAGLAFALAFAVKQTALLFLPLALGLALLPLPEGAGAGDAWRRLAACLRPIGLWLLLAGVFIFGWDLARQADIGFWAQGYSDNMPGRLVRANEVWPRARAWLDLLGGFTASSPLNLLLALVLPLLLAAGLPSPSRAGLADFILAGFALLYLAAYWLLAFNVWDRYLLPIQPVFALLLARVLLFTGYAVDRALHQLGRRHLSPSRILPLASTGLPALLVLLILPSALTAARSGYAIGGDHGAYDGIDRTAQYLRSLPEGGVLYDHWLSWEWSFYLFDGPLYVAWFASPQTLAEDLAAFGRASPRYLVIPAWEAEAEIRQAAAQAGFRLVPLHTAYRRDGALNFTTYQLTP